jgi:hypothetical protein
MGIYPHGERGWGRNAPRKSSWGSPRGILFVTGTGMRSQNPTGISPLPSLSPHDEQEKIPTHCGRRPWSNVSLHHSMLRILVFLDPLVGAQYNPCSCSPWSIKGRAHVLQGERGGERGSLELSCATRPHGLKHPGD